MITIPCGRRWKSWNTTSIPASRSLTGRYKGSITEGDLLWGLKTKNLVSIKETEGINVMKIHRRNDYQYVTSNAKMEDQRDLLLASWETPNYVKISHFQEFQIV